MCLCVHLSDPANTSGTDNSGIWTYHVHVSGPALGRVLHQDDPTMWHVASRYLSGQLCKSYSHDILESKPIGLENISVARGHGQEAN